MTSRSPPSRRWPTVLLVLALAPAVVVGGGFDGYAPLFLALFDGVEDGHGEGDSYPAAHGELTTYAADPHRYSDVGPLSGIYDEALVLTDTQGRSDVDFGVWAQTTSAARTTVAAGFDVALLQPQTQFVAEVTDITGVDISVGIRAGAVSVNGVTIATAVRARDAYRVLIILMPFEDTPDLFFVAVSLVSTGEIIGEWTGPIPGGFEPVTGLRLEKSGVAPGAVWLDRIGIAAIGS